MKTLLLAALVPAALTILPPSAPASAGETPTCRGQEATHVGTPNEALTTTPGPDVVVTNGAYVVRTLNGDDIICVTESGHPFIVPGGGDDVVDARPYEGDQLETSLGLRPVAGSTGDDLYVGGDQLEIVYVASGVPGDHKEIYLDGGDDDLRVDSGYPGTLEANLGTGSDRYWTERSRHGADVDGEEGRDLLVTKCLGCRSLKVELGSGLVVINQDRYSRAAGFEDADLLNTGSPLLRRAVILGTRAPNRIRVAACDSRIEGRDGNDLLWAETASDPGCAGSKARLFGGGGADDLTGTAGDDVLRGATGQDEADGRGGTDLCRAEVTVRCEG